MMITVMKQQTEWERCDVIILEPEILGNHNINTGKTLLLKTIVN